MRFIVDKPGCLGVFMGVQTAVCLDFLVFGCCLEGKQPCFLGCFGCVGICVGVLELPAEIMGFYRREYSYGEKI